MIEANGIPDSWSFSVSCRETGRAMSGVKIDIALNLDLAWEFVKCKKAGRAITKNTIADKKTVFLIWNNSFLKRRVNITSIKGR